MLSAILVMCAACSDRREQMSSRSFGTTKDGDSVSLYKLTNPKGMSVEITNYGGIITSIVVPDRQGKFADVVLGFDSLDGYLGRHPYFGAIVGRYGNRIANGKFSIGPDTFTLAKNDGENALHGGLRGFDKVVWSANGFTEKESRGVELKYTSKDGEEGYPGDLYVTVRYTLTDGNELRIEYSAMTTMPTVLNLTNHSYFNLAGQGEGDILNHEVTINADRFTPVNSVLIPTGQLQSVTGTPFDFTKPLAIGARINADHEQIKLGGGYDHNFVLNGRGMRLVAEVVEPKSGRAIEVRTTQPGMQFYTGNFLDGTIRGKQGKVYNRRYGFCMETQHFPDSPNQPAFPSTLLRPGEQYLAQTSYTFSNR
jgi:aldose 1-epimerase